MASDVAQSIQRIIAQIIAYRIITGAMSAIPGMPGPAHYDIVPRFAARGGPIFGRGTGTSDSIPAMLSHGEYVLNARVVKEIGLDELNRINFGRQSPLIRPRHRFATGGLVQAPPKVEGGGGMEAVLGLEEGLVLRHLQTSEGTRAIVKVIAANPKAFRRALGV
jgi:hypothetical protein